MSLEQKVSALATAIGTDVKELYALITGINSGAPTIYTVEVNLSNTPKRSGKFTISGTGFSIGNPVLINKATGPYTGKGTLSDEVEMDNISVSASVTTASVITAYWQSSSPIRGNVKFNYLIGA